MEYKISFNNMLFVISEVRVRRSGLKFRGTAYASWSCGSAKMPESWFSE